MYEKYKEDKNNYKNADAFIKNVLKVSMYVVHMVTVLFYILTTLTYVCISAD